MERVVMTGPPVASAVVTRRKLARMAGTISVAM
jgi:hypothetical protein